MNEYRRIEALNSTTLASFFESPDHCLMGFKEKPYFEFGKAFELKVCRGFKPAKDLILWYMDDDKCSHCGNTYLKLNKYTLRCMECFLEEEI